jgi:hypothetical protein
MLPLHPFKSLTHIRRACVSVVTLAAFLPLAVGCTSNEYVIPHEELARLAATPPPQRGTRVRVVQDLGDRRSDPVEMTTAPPAPQRATDDETASDDGAEVNVQLNVSGGGQSSGRGGPSINGGGKGGGGRGISGGHVGGGGGGGGGGGNGDAALVVLIVVVAVVVAIGLVSSEGVRFDGYVAMSPEQPVHLRAANGQTTTLRIADLSPGLVEGSVEAKVMDDEGSGLRRLDRLPLDRRGATFKLDSGTMAFDFGGAALAGPTMNVQAGYFFTRKLGLVANLGLGGGTTAGGLVPRHALGLELQAFPLAWGRVHLGAFGNGGMAITEVLVGPNPTYLNGPSVGGGALAELDLTSRLALTLRAGGSLAKLDQLWTPAGQLTAGVAVY